MVSVLLNIGDTMKLLIIYNILALTGLNYAQAQTCDSKPTEPPACAQARAIVSAIPQAKMPQRKAPAAAAATPNVDQSQQMMNTMMPIIIITGNQAPPAPVQVQAPPPPAPVVAPPQQRIRIVKEYVKEFVKVNRPRKKNTVSLLAGSGPGKVFTAVSNEGTQVTTKQSVIFGAEYQRHFDNDFVLGITVISNTSALVGVGLDF
jgi:hypothetical protein